MQQAPSPRPSLLPPHLPGPPPNHNFVIVGQQQPSALVTIPPIHHQNQQGTILYVSNPSPNLNMMAAPSMIQHNGDRKLIPATLQIAQESQLTQSILLQASSQPFLVLPRPEEQFRLGQLPPPPPQPHLQILHPQQQLQQELLLHGSAPKQLGQPLPSSSSSSSSLCAVSTAHESSNSVPLPTASVTEQSFLSEPPKIKASYGLSTPRSSIPSQGDSSAKERESIGSVPNSLNSEIVAPTAAAVATCTGLVGQSSVPIIEDVEKYKQKIAEESHKVFSARTVEHLEDECSDISYQSNVKSKESHKEGLEDKEKKECGLLDIEREDEVSSASTSTDRDHEGSSSEDSHITDNAGRVATSPVTVHDSSAQRKSDPSSQPDVPRQEQGSAASTAEVNKGRDLAPKCTCTPGRDGGHTCLLLFRHQLRGCTAQER